MERIEKILAEKGLEWVTKSGRTMRQELDWQYLSDGPIENLDEKAHKVVTSRILSNLLLDFGRLRIADKEKLVKGFGLRKKMLDIPEMVWRQMEIKFDAMNHRCNIDYPGNILEVLSKDEGIKEYALTFYPQYELESLFQKEQAEEKMRQKLIRHVVELEVGLEAKKIKAFLIEKVTKEIIDMQRKEEGLKRK